MTPERYTRIKNLFTEAAELPESERDAFLDRECDGDADLRKEVVALLQYDDSQTIIAASDKTVADFSRTVVADSTRTSLSNRLRGLVNLTKHLGPRGHLAIGALIASLVIALLAHFGNRNILRFQKELRREALKEIVDGKVLALEMWLEHEEEKIASWARSKKLRQHIGQLVKLANEPGQQQASLSQSPDQQAIREELHSLAGHEVYYSIWDRRHVLIADTFTEIDRVGKNATPRGASVLAFVFEGNSKLMAFDRKNAITEFDTSIRVEAHMGSVTPIRDEDGSVIAALLVHDYRSREDASRILSMVRLGESGETYVFNRNGLMLSKSRFDDQLRQWGLISDEPAATSVRSVYVRDPGGDLTAGFVPDEPLSARPLTKMARLCTSGHDGDDLDGYRDYRGITVVGAWRWLEDLEIGVATELDVDEAEPGLQILIWETWLIVGLLALCLGITLLSYYSVRRLRQQVGENRKLGHYTLEKQIGEGGMGKVFKAQHELLKRPTAVKLLKPAFFDRDSTARFEREARLVSQLEHPNTIRIYDFGATPEGLFYYVMEYIDGLSLSELVDVETVVAPQRVIFLLKQICYSLREAHEAGLVHRDLKPGNIMVCARGGEFDVAKVLDFGLVKHIETPKSQEITTTDMVAGTPQYIAPERLRDPQTNDPRSDIYSLGAVAYFLMTGRDLVSGGSLAEILVQVVQSPPRRPSDCSDEDIPDELDDLVFHCLAKVPRDRPSSVAELIAVLDGIQPETPWTQSEAKEWWKRFKK